MYYIAVYTKSDDEEERFCSPAAKTKVEAIASTIVRAGKSITIISPSMTMQKKKKYNSRCFKVAEKITCIQFASSSKAHRITKKIQKTIADLKLFFFIIKNIKKMKSSCVSHN